MACDGTKGTKNEMNIEQMKREGKKRMQTTRIETIAREMNISMVGVFEISEAHHFFLLFPYFSFRS